MTDTSTARPSYITSRRDLEELSDRLRSHSRIALDTEFVGEESFVPKLELIQVAAGNVSAVIDFPAVQTDGSLDVFWDVVCDPRIEKIFHAGRQDLDLIAGHAGQIPKPFFDTQVAASMLGYGAQIAYANLVQRVIGTKLAKAHTFTNWSARPLSNDQIVYAAEDVQFLLSIHTVLLNRLEHLGRLEWVQEEFARLEAAVGEKGREPLDRYQRIRGWDSLRPKHAAVLRDLAAWRESEARRRNVPRGRVMRDEVLLQLARHPARTLDELRGVRGLHASEADRHGEHLLKLIASTLASPPASWPEVPRERKPEPESRGVVELLQAILKARAAEAEIAPTLLATSAEIQAMVDAAEKQVPIDLPVLRGWRYTIVGELLTRVLNGSVAVSIDAASRSLRVTPMTNPGT
ncbi:Ribonuclease D [Nitrospira sp. KM1]|uniref:ribonuclease D n=1 Tax=Nitrospira sp. KM1 TaxID=1936990 RepID=UPI0013A76709|nr:ribonuclease D [Nitrospira sp. KM1]BCA53538.1 Ribonuclease D [Nitrospira sp. KM1]